MNDHFQTMTLAATGATALFEMGVIQSLWSGYGKIVRYGLKDAPMKSVVVKHVRLPDQGKHPGAHFVPPGNAHRLANDSRLHGRGSLAWPR